MAQIEKWLGLELMVFVATSSVLLGSFTQALPSQEYSAKVDSIAGPRSASLYWIVML